MNGAIVAASPWALWIPAIAAVGGAAVAGVFAFAARRSDAQAQRTRDLENRLAERKRETYQLMTDWLGRVMSSETIQQAARPRGKPGQLEKADLVTLMRFSTWIRMYGSGMRTSGGGS
jgi:hypothetical protein